MATKKKKHHAATKRKRYLTLPDEFIRKSLVEAPVPAAQGGPLKGQYQYVVETRRHEGNWRVHIQWVETRDKVLIPQVVDLPHQVVERIFSHRDQILKESVSAGRKKAHLTRAAASDGLPSDD